MGLKGHPGVKILAAIAVAIAVGIAAPAPAVAEPSDTVVLPPSVGRGAGRRHTKRIERSLRKSIKKLDGVSLGSKRDEVSAGCSVDVVCLANKGAELEAKRVVGVSLTRKKKQFTLTFVVAQVQPARELARVEMSTTSRGALGREAPEQLDKALAAADEAAASDTATGDGGEGEGAAEGAAEGEAALSVAPPAGVAGDGRSAAPIEISGGPPPQPGELAKRPEVATVECDVGLALPATTSAAPAVLAPAVSAARELSCVARLRGAEATFTLPVTPPTQPGLYAGHELPRVRANDQVVSLTPFVVDEAGQSAPATPVRAASSAGEVEFVDGKLVLTLPKKRPPRAVAIAMTDGLHVGAVFIPVWGVTKLDVRAERRSEVSIRIAGRWWGPKAARRGFVRLPIEVPPGVRTGVVRAVRNDAAVESVANLRTPRLRRIAALAFSDEVPAGGANPIIVAVAEPDGRPAPDDAPVYAKARKGTVTDAKALGGGLWQIDYTAPATPTRDRIVVRRRGDRYAGRATIKLEVVLGAAKMIHVSLPDRTFKPGDQVTGAVFVRDSAGNLLEDATPTATLVGEPVELTRGATGFGFELQIPERLPVDGPLSLRVTAGELTRDRVIPVRPEEPVSATLALSSSGRKGTALVEVRDRHGNLVPAKTFAVSAIGATAGALRRVGDRYEMPIHALGDSHFAAVEVRVAEAVLARGSVRFGPGRDAVYFGAWTEGGWVASGGDFSAPRAGLGLGVRRLVGPIELGLGVGAEAFMFEDSPTAMIGGESRELTRSLSGLAVPAHVRGRLPLSDHLGMSLDLAVVPTRVSVGLATDFQPDDDYTELVIGARGQLALDWLLGSARARVGVSYGTATLADGPVTGRIEGLGVTAGVEWWFAALQP